MRTRREGHSWWIIACGLMVMTLASTASASELDVCVHVLETFTNPSYEYGCGSWGSIWPPARPDAICFVNPLCCTPGVCKVTPACGIAKVIIETIQAGDAHCFHGISAQDLWQRWKDRQIAFAIDLAPCAVNLLLCGVPEALLPLVKADIAVIAAAGHHLPEHLQKLLKDILAPMYDYGNTGFGHEDISNIKIINQSHNVLTKMWLSSSQDGHPGITLGPVIILRDDRYNQLMAPAHNYTLVDLLIGHNINQAYTRALGLMIHEMVHVKQFRVLGQDTFFLNYLAKNAPLITDGYGHDPYEREALNFTADILELHGGQLCALTAAELDDSNRRYDLGRDPVQCIPYIPLMIPILSF